MTKKPALNTIDTLHGQELIADEIKQLLNDPELPKARAIIMIALLPDGSELCFTRGYITTPELYGLPQMVEELCQHWGHNGDDNGESEDTNANENSH